MRIFLCLKFGWFLVPVEERLQYCCRHYVSLQWRDVGMIADEILRSNMQSLVLTFFHISVKLISGRKQLDIRFPAAFPKWPDLRIYVTRAAKLLHSVKSAPVPFTKVAARNYTRPKKWPFCQTRVYTARMAFRDCVIMAHATFSAARLVGIVACSIIYIRECSQRNECCDDSLALGFLSSTLQQKMRRADLVMIWMYIIRQYTFWNVVQKMRLIQKVIGF
ncbi:Hypothetical_protein [Hexamita inflata]|uniref:Hypothetical_protein n=1 Tax=Hexamita inflata TaxID=28002 RepID=A0AA86PBD5_9EUKA|nr:Hypothetical protein HINF_LOCUS21220 [Hexamita inflata]